VTFLFNFVFSLVHDTTSGFRGLWWGANLRGVHFAAGPDWMHLMLEGLGKHILTYIEAMLKAAGIYHLYRLFMDNVAVFAGQLAAVDAYIAQLNRRSSALPSSIKKVSNGLSELHTVSAMDLPGILLQVSLALGCHNSIKMPMLVVKKIQRTIYFFFALQRSRSLEEHSETDVQVPLVVMAF
jgi:hypothetical protein